MYNLYTYLNQVKKKEDLIEEEKKKKKINKNLKYLNDVYANNFNDKLKNFIFEMCKEPIIVNNSSYDKKKIHQNNKFIFNQYITEKQRIENLLNQEKPFVKKKIKIKKIKNLSNNKIIKKNENNFRNKLFKKSISISNLNNNNFKNDKNNNNKNKLMKNNSYHTFFNSIMDKFIINKSEMNNKRKNNKSITNIFDCDNNNSYKINNSYNKNNIESILYKNIQNIQNKKIKPLNKIVVEDIDKKLFYLKKLSNSSKFLGNIKLNYETLNDEQKESSDVDLEKKINEEDNLINIDNKLFKKDDYKEISKFILKKCHFINKKFDEKEKGIKIGEGKLMMTNGMSINEFAAKYSLPYLKQNNKNLV